MWSLLQSEENESISNFYVRSVVCKSLIWVQEEEMKADESYEKKGSPPLSIRLSMRMRWTNRWMMLRKKGSSCSKQNKEKKNGERMRKKGLMKKYMLWDSIEMMERKKNGNWWWWWQCPNRASKQAADTSYDDYNLHEEK